MAKTKLTVEDWKTGAAVVGAALLLLLYVGAALFFVVVIAVLLVMMMGWWALTIPGVALLIFLAIYNSARVTRNIREREESTNVDGD